MVLSCLTPVDDNKWFVCYISRSHKQKIIAINKSGQTIQASLVEIDLVRRVQLSPDEYLPFSNLILYFTVSRLIELKEKIFQIGQHDFIISRLPHYVRHMTLICTTLNPFCPVWLNLAMWFWRKCHWCLSNVNRQTDRQWTTRDQKSSLELLVSLS